MLGMLRLLHALIAMVAFMPMTAAKIQTSR